MAGKFRGKTTWDPTLILFQISTIQFIGYTSIIFMVLVVSILTDNSPSISSIFNHSNLRLGSGKLVILAYIVNAVVGAYLLRRFVERSKSCLDFTITFHALHLLFVWYYTRSLPDTFIWYFINTISILVMCVTGEFLCRRDEMKCIPITASV